MSRPFVYLTAVTIMIAAMSTPVGAQKHYKELVYPPINDIRASDPTRVTLKNGIILYLVEDHRLPLISLRARIGVGGINESADKVGLAGITGAVMRSGGTATMSGDEIDEVLEGIGASIETSIGNASGSASMSLLKDNIDLGLSILADILMNPAFPEDKIELQKVQERSSIARRNDDPTNMGFREFSKLIYGAESVFARHTEYATLDAVTRDDLLAFHKAYYHPNNLMIGIWGDFDSGEIRKKIEAAFQTWEKTNFKRPKTPTVDYTFDNTVDFIRKEDINQSTVVLGHIGGLRNNPDYFALQVMNDILSGGFSGRLMRHVRSDQGLAYAVFGQYSGNYNYPGIFYVGCMTKSETTVQAIRSMLHEVEQMKQETVTEEELALAKESFLNSFVFNFDTKGEIINRQMTYEYYDYPRNFLEKTKDGIEKVTKADVQRVAQKYLQPDKVRILVVGNDKDFDEALSVLGEVNEIDVAITMPGMSSDTPPASEDDMARGKALFERSIEAAGGSDAFKAVQEIRQKGTVLIVTPQGEIGLDIEILVSLPNKMRVTSQTPMGEIVQILNGDQAWMITPMGTQPAPPSVKTSMMENIWQDLAFLYGQAETEGLTIQHIGQENVEGKTAEILLITPPGFTGFNLYIDTATMLPVKKVARAMSPQGPVEIEDMLSDYREVAGMMLPFKSTTKRNGHPGDEVTIGEIEINPTLAEELFTVPG